MPYMIGCFRQCYDSRSMVRLHISCPKWQSTKVVDYRRTMPSDGVVMRSGRCRCPVSVHLPFCATCRPGLGQIWVVKRTIDYLGCLPVLLQSKKVIMGGPLVCGRNRQGARHQACGKGISNRSFLAGSGIRAQPRGE